MSESHPWLTAGYMKDWLKFRYERDNIPGFVIAVSQNGKLVFNEAYGYANLERKEKMTTDHIFRIASHSKTFTATAIMQLQEQGKLKIDDKVVDYVSWLKEHKDKRWQHVTIRQLLSHGAGVIRDGLDSDYWQLYRQFPDEAEFQKEILAADLVLDNNVKMKYSNYGYTLLGFVIEAASGREYNEYVVEKIVKPLGLEDTGPEPNDNISDRLVTGYTRPDYGKERLPIAQINTYAMSPATGFYSTAADLCDYFTAHIVGSGKLLDDESKKEMQRTHWRAENTEHVEEYGLGLEMMYVNDKRLFGHGGGFPGHITNSFFDPENKTVVVVLTNGMRAWVTAITKGIFKNIYFAMDHNKPIDKKLRKYQGRFMSLWQMVDIMPVEDKLIAAFPDAWEPFEHPDELEYVKKDTFKIAKTDSFSALGELVHFNFAKDGQIKSVIYGGETLLPQKDYLTKSATMAQIDLKVDT